MKMTKESEEIEDMDLLRSLEPRSKVSFIP
jgi:hypothetical protein